MVCLPGKRCSPCGLCYLMVLVALHLEDTCDSLRHEFAHFVALVLYLLAHELAARLSLYRRL